MVTNLNAQTVNVLTPYSVVMVKMIVKINPTKIHHCAQNYHVQWVDYVVKIINAFQEERFAMEKINAVTVLMKNHQLVEHLECAIHINLNAKTATVLTRNYSAIIITIVATTAMKIIVLHRLVNGIPVRRFVWNENMETILVNALTDTLRNITVKTQPVKRRDIPLVS